MIKFKLLVVVVALNAICAQAPAMALSEAARNWSELQKAGSEALDTNKYWIAEPMLKAAIIKAGSFGNSDLRLAKSLGELGRLYTVRGRFADAEPFLEEELSVKEQALGKDQGQTIVPMGSLIKFYLNYGTASKAQPLTEQVLQFVEGKLNEPVPEAKVQNKFHKGLALEGWAGQADLEARDPLLEWAITCDDLANHYRARGDYELADRLYKAALDVKSTILGKDHLSLANSYDSLGMLYTQKKDHKEAESYFKSALVTTEKILPPESPEVYSRIDKLAKCLIKEGKYRQAEELYRRARELQRAEPTRGDESRPLFALGCLYVEEKRYAAAAPILHQALEAAESINGPASISLVPYIEKYAYALYHLGHRSDVSYLHARANTISGGTRQQ